MSKHDSSAHSFTDLMTSVAVIFILLFVAVTNNSHVEKTRTIEDLKDKVTGELERLGLKLEADPTDPYLQYIVIDEDKLRFGFNRAEIPTTSRSLLTDLFNVLVPAVCKDEIRNKIEYVKIEGHSDLQGEQGLSGKIKNVSLSQRRALAVLEQAFRQIEKDKPMFTCFRELAMPVGMGSTRPKDTYAKSRRVQIALKVTSPRKVANKIESITGNKVKY